MRWVGSVVLLLQWTSVVAAFGVVPRRLPSFDRSSVRMERGVVLGLSATPTVETEQVPCTKVQRVYESFVWTYPPPHDNDDDKASPDKASQDYTINYRVEGPVDGPPILLVHGFGASVNHFRFQFPALVAQGYRVYAIDLIGFGASAKPAHVPYSIALFTQLVVDFVAAMNPDQPWFLAGNSIGGLVCLATAAQLPVSRVQGIVLFNCSGGMSTFRYADVPWYLRPILWMVQNIVLNPRGSLGASFFAKFATRANVESILTQSGVYVNTTHVDEELLQILLEPADDEGAQDVFLRVFGGPPGPAPESLLPLIVAPILAQWGDADPWTPLDGGAHPATQLHTYYTAGTSWTLDVLPKTGHCPHDENPDGVHEKMLPWLRETRASYRPGSLLLLSSSSSK
jgi:pimeloyl-ACP methyl ester carboxylesterase